MINILFASSDNIGLSQIAESFANKFLKGHGGRAYSINTGIAREVHSQILSELDGRGVKISKEIKDVSDLPFKSIELLVSIVSVNITEKSLFLPGYPTRIKLRLREHFEFDSENNVIKGCPKVISEIERKVEVLCKSSYLAALVDATQTTRFLFDSLSEGIIAHDIDRKITFFNNAAEEITGYTRKEVIGRDCHDVFPGKFCGLKCAFCNGCPDFDSVKYNTDIYTKCGSKKSIEMSVTGVRGNEKELIGVLASFRDRTKEVDLEIRLNKTHSFSGIIGKDPQMLEVFDLIRSVADSKAPVMIYGASGTGKELVASAIHFESCRRDKRFITVNCGAIPENLLESELFGHTKGAFTGAIRDKKGRFELADGGTIFLDEIGDISQAMQVKLLRVLQEGTFEKIGGEKTIKVNVRVISATNKHLKDEIAEGRFREDLYYRLSVVPVSLPTLFERRGDIPLIADELLKRVMESEERTDNVKISRKAMNVLLDYEWPGNIRELQNWLQFALIKAPKGGVILPQHFPIQNISSKPSSDNKDIFKTKKKKRLTEDTVRDALVKAKGNKVAAAKLLGVGRATLYRFLDSLKE